MDSNWKSESKQKVIAQLSPFVVKITSSWTDAANSNDLLQQTEVTDEP